MGKIGKKTREKLGLIDKEDKEPEVGKVTEAEEETKATPLMEKQEEPKAAKSKITAFGVKSELDGDDKIVYTCVSLVVEDGKIVKEENLSPNPRNNKALVLEDWKLSTGKFILRRDEW